MVECRLAWLFQTNKSPRNKMIPYPLTSSFPRTPLTAHKRDWGNRGSSKRALDWCFMKGLTKCDDKGRTPREAHVSSRFCMSTRRGLTTTSGLPQWLPMLYILCSYKERAFCCWKGLWNMVLCQIIFFLNKDMRWPLLKERLGIPLPPTSPWRDTRLRTDVFGRGERNQPTHLKLTVGKTHLPLI